MTYTYGISDAQKGRLKTQTDATGTQEFGYGLMGEVVENTRVIKMFGMPDRTFSTRFTYDSWNRLQTMVYPDGEQVNYKYDLGGNLKQVTSTINGTTKNYVSQMDYDHYEQKTYMKYGNNTENSYTYSYSTRRLENLKAKASDGGAMFDNNYAYDKVGNVTAIDNIGGQVFNYLGGTYSNNFTYDKLNRLTDASGSFSGMELLFNGTNERDDSYTLAMQYNDVHQIIKKTQAHNSNAILSYNNNTLDFDYSLFEDNHKVETVMDQVTGLTTQFTYDANGNLTRKTENSGIENNYIWDEENRLRAAYYEQMMQYNLYDAAGERIIKMNGEQSSLFENGSPSDGTTLTMNQFTVYPSANLTYNEELQYTKHYYIGSQRIVSRIGEENLNSFTITESVLKTTGVVKDELGEAQRKDLNRIARKAGAGIVKLGEAKEDAASAKTGGDSEEDEPSDSVLPPTTLPIYYFHPDHLGSSSFITDNDGNPAEFFLNLPFGETFVEQRSNTTMLNNPYKFTGKELDENTGLYYYGARFYDPKLSLWLSVDPLAEKTMTPYAYCNNNPINLIDPTGMEAEGPGDPIEPSPAGLLYEMRLHMEAAIFNFSLKIAEAFGGGKPGYNTRKETQIDDYLGMRNVIVSRPEGTWGQATKETAIDALSLIPASTPAKGGMSAVPGILARVPVKSAVVSFMKQTGNVAVEIKTHLPKGYKLTNYFSKGEEVYTNGKKFITPDVTSHKGGIWKMYDDVKKLGSKDRVGTYDANLNKIAK